MGSIKSHTLGRNERLKSRKAIEYLFAEGKSFSLSPFKVIYKKISGGTGVKTNDESLKAAFSVAKRYFKKAVERNRTRRLMKEAYRLQKNSLKDELQQNKQTLAVFIIFTGKELPEYSLVHSKMGGIIKRLLKIINEEHAANT